MTTKTDTEQERADFEAWADGKTELYNMQSGEYSSRITRLAFEAYQAGRAALQSQQSEPNDLMLSAVLRMPFDMAMADHLSRYQFYKRAQQALNELEALQSQDKEDAERYRALVASGHFIPAQTPYFSVWGLRTTERKASKAELDEAIDHARRAEGET